MATNQISSSVEKEFNYINPSEQMRMVRGYAIISKGDVPQRIDKNTFSIHSQNNKGDYIVKIGKVSSCTCPDFKERKRNCKHIHAVKFFLELNNKIKIEHRGIVSEKGLVHIVNLKIQLDMVRE